ncbi:MAG: thymidine kinase [Candidatus Iainarchaeum archaeon]|uniref:thymidine kinase n=1 Tax=Candidatus Iainarchaeum sp. TaxID=3101447 RepID=A0A7T9I253_9ARCH|nr:MAG: thymidine kinase [Candidatus Diapherotrites archaeon]
MGSLRAFNPFIRPGYFEVFCGPMKSGKSLALLHRVEKLKYMKHASFLFVKPKLDTRDSHVRTRFHDVQHACVFVDESRPEEILSLLDGHALVAIDEAHFFNARLVPVIKELLEREVNVVVSGLDLDFRGEPFGPMPALLSFADEVHKLSGVCDYDGCSNPATRTQRLVDGAPARYDSPIFLIGDAKEVYQYRCLFHHEVVGKPHIDFESLSKIEQQKLG